jgi:hypothetical protein
MYAVLIQAILWQQSHRLSSSRMECTHQHGSNVSAVSSIHCESAPLIIPDEFLL